MKTYQTVFSRRLGSSFVKSNVREGEVAPPTKNYSWAILEEVVEARLQ